MPPSGSQHGSLGIMLTLQLYRTWEQAVLSFPRKIILIFELIGVENAFKIFMSF